MNSDITKVVSGIAMFCALVVGGFLYCYWVGPRPEVILNDQKDTVEYDNSKHESVKVEFGCDCVVDQNLKIDWGDESLQADPNMKIELHDEPVNVEDIQSANDIPKIEDSMPDTLSVDDEKDAGIMILNAPVGFDFQANKDYHDGTITIGHDEPKWVIEKDDWQKCTDSEMQSIATCLTIIRNSPCGPAAESEIANRLIPGRFKVK